MTSKTVINESSEAEQNNGNQHSIRFSLEPENAKRLANLCGQLDSHIKQVSEHYKVKVFSRGHKFQLEGNLSACEHAQDIFQRLYRETHNGTQITPDLIHLLLQEDHAVQAYDKVKQYKQNHCDEIKTPQLIVKARGLQQQAYVSQIHENVLTFGIGPAGTGKTFLAVACAVEALLRNDIKRILLVRPAVEAGEKLGFLPGDLSQKIDPYLRPLYDALHDMLGSEQVEKLIERNVIEVAPLAYMRGRTLSHSFIILDESQNTTKEQMKMFLTRIGFGSQAVVTGDISQVDLPRGVYSGLRHVLEVLQGVDGIGLTHFNSSDVVRHPLVQRIVNAYEKFEAIEEDNYQAKKAARQNSQQDN